MIVLLFVASMSIALIILIGGIMESGIDIEESVINS